MAETIARMTYTTIKQMQAANKAAGHHWFDAESMSFFNSKIESGVIGGRYFITSEQYEDSYGERPFPRKYTVRVCDERGHVDTVGDFQRFDTLKEAHAEAVKIAGQL